MSTWQDDPFAFGDGFDDLEFEQASGSTPPGSTKNRDGVGVTLVIVAAAVVAAIVALVMGANHAGWATVVVGALAYLMAAAGDLRQRSRRRSRRVYARPWASALLRLLVFWAAVGAAWMAASGLAASGLAAP